MSIAGERFKKYEKTELDIIMIYIKSGTIKCGRFSHLVKVDPKRKMKGKVFFDDGNGSAESAEDGKSERR